MQTLAVMALVGLALTPIAFATSGNGAIVIPFTTPPGLPAGTELWLQWAIVDATAVHGIALSNAVLGLTP